MTTKSIGDVDNEDEDENYEASTEDEESDESDEADYSDASADNYSDANIHLRRSSRQRQPPERYIGESVCLVREVEGEVGVVMVSERLIREVEGAEVVREVDRNNDYLGCIDHFGCYWTIKVMREEIMEPGSIWSDA